MASPNAALLDIGCGDGGFLTLARRKGCQVYGIDIDGRAIRLAKDVRGHDKVVAGRWEEIGGIEGWGDFDIVTAFDVLEHVSSPLTFTSTVWQLLRAGGIACVTVPRLDRYPPIFDADSDWPPHHLTLWTSKALSVLLTKVGFGEIRVIEKPLTANDLLAHLVLRGKRFIRGVRRKGTSRDPGEPVTGEGGAIEGMIAIVAMAAKRSAIVALTGVNWLFRFLRLGRGHTLLVIARKAQNEPEGTPLGKG